MLSIAPIPRLLSAALFVVAIFAARTLFSMTLIYALVLVGVAACQVVKPHLRFVVFVTGPLLLALLIVWGWLVDPRQIPAPHSGFSYAAFTWLRIVACGGILQCLFLPLVEYPAQLRGFASRKEPLRILASVTALGRIRSRFRGENRSLSPCLAPWRADPSGLLWIAH